MARLTCQIHVKAQPYSSLSFDQQRIFRWRCNQDPSKELYCFTESHLCFTQSIDGEESEFDSTLIPQVTMTTLMHVDLAYQCHKSLLLRLERAGERRPYRWKNRPRSIEAVGSGKLCVKLPTFSIP